jgi:hypothetical protein
MDKGMKKVVNLVTNYMSALCETGRVPGRVNRKRNYTHFKLSKLCALKR